MSEVSTPASVAPVARKQAIRVEIVSNRHREVSADVQKRIVELALGGGFVGLGIYQSCEAIGREAKKNNEDKKAYEDVVYCSITHSVRLGNAEQKIVERLPDNSNLNLVVSPARSGDLVACHVYGYDDYASAFKGTVSLAASSGISPAAKSNDGIHKEKK